MSNWRDSILSEFVPSVSRLTLVADPDELLLEERVLEGIRNRGFNLIPFEDHVAFRYAYESKFRSQWDKGQQTDLVVVLRSPASDLNTLPYDLLQAGRRLSFSLGDIFPNLSYPVVAALNRADLDDLYEAQRRHAPGRLGDNATKEFVLRHVFEIAPELIKQPSDLLRVLLRRHYLKQQIPAMLDERFIQLLRERSTFTEWPLEMLVRDREAFFRFVQERWPVFLNRTLQREGKRIREAAEPYCFSIEGPADLPFDHHDVRVYLDNLFLEGLLEAVPCEQPEAFSGKWISVGVQTRPEEDRINRLGRLIDNLVKSRPSDEARHSEWMHFARGWAELNVLWNEQDETTPKEMAESIKGLQSQVSVNFTAWLSKRFAGLINLPPSPPVMLHHLPRFLARQMGDDHRTKVALLLVDGLSMDQWLVARTAIVSRDARLQFRESSVFSWVPSITSVSRQTAFAGKAPVFFPSSIHTTEREPTLWAQFWADQGLTPNEIVYSKGLGDGSLDSIEEKLSHPKVRVAGLVVDMVDRIMHGMELGTAGMHNQVRQWAQQPYLTTLLNLLLSKGFRVFLTSDHGNVEAQGFGRPTEGAVAELRGERARIYSDPVLRDSVSGSFPTAIKWDPVGLPDSYFPLLAPRGKAFVREGERLVSHGGISIEEIIVPLVQVERMTG